jgi:hypothetical protein
METMSERRGLLHRFFDFYSVYFGVTSPPPAKQKLVLALLLAFLLITGLLMYLVAHFASTL